MSGQVPPSLKSADIARFVQRAAQLQNAKPVIAYWCDYWTAQQILTKGLHSVDQDALTFTTNLMDKLEKFKSEHSTDESVTDDVAGKAVVEQFALETFQRADNAMRADKASRQTADTFQASSTFFELLEIWGPVDAETRQKIRFAKFHALRITRAIKNGEDPNLSNPKPEPLPEELIPQLDPNDPEVLAINGDESKPRQPSVVEIPDVTHTLQADLARQSSIDRSIHPSRAPSVPPPSQVEVESGNNNNISPLPKETEEYYSGHQTEISPVTPERKLSAGGNYFPKVPSPSQEEAPQIPPALPSTPNTLGSHPLNLPSAPPDLANSATNPTPPPPTLFSMSQPTKPDPPSNTIAPAPAAAPPSFTPAPTNQSQFIPPPQSMAQSTPARQSQGNVHTPSIPIPSNIMAQPSFSPPPVVPLHQAYPPPPVAPMTTNVIIDDEAILKAQKHAKWAISALNFEDVPTAIREFQAALQTLGAR